MRLRHILPSFGIGTRIFNFVGRASFSSAPANEKKSYWRESATVLIAKPTSDTSDSKSKQGIEFLITARSEKAKFMPGGLCFPGGNLSDADSSNQWLDLFKNSGAGDKIKNFRWLEPSARKPEIYQTDDSTGQGALPKEVSLRITAIRETFEECGLLFCRPASGSQESSSLFELPDSEIIKWQKRVKANPDEFLTMCHGLKIVPSLQEFREWSNWLTPVMYKPTKTGRSRRFDAIFYMVLLKEPKSPKVIIDPEEVGSYLWSTSHKLLENHLDDVQKLMPPQLYEIGRLRDSNMEDLENMLKSRQKLGIERWCPHVRLASDGAVGCLPGDDMMPKNVDIYNYSEMGTLDKTLAELEKSSTNLHRWQIGSDGTYKLLVNTHNHGQTYPSDENALFGKMKLYS